eukprot:scaffold934_cov191-Alexandrium_tamarense.AAC.30
MKSDKQLMYTSATPSLSHKVTTSTSKTGAGAGEEGPQLLEVREKMCCNSRLESASFEESA